MARKQSSPGQADPLNLRDYGVVFATFSSLEAITEGDAVYVNTSSYIGRAQANASSTMQAIGVAQRGILSGQPGRVITGGRKSTSNYSFSGFHGRQGYVSTGSAGGVQTTPPTSSGQVSQVLGFIADQTTLFVQPQRTWQVGGSLNVIG